MKIEIQSLLKYLTVAIVQYKLEATIISETNEYLQFDREKSAGMRLDIPSGTAEI